MAAGRPAQTSHGRAPAGRLPATPSSTGDRSGRVADTCRRFLLACMRSRGSAGRRHAKKRHVRATCGQIVRKPMGACFTQHGTRARVPVLLGHRSGREPVASRPHHVIPVAYETVGMVYMLPSAEAVISSHLWTRADGRRQRLWQVLYGRKNASKRGYNLQTVGAP